MFKYIPTEWLQQVLCDSLWMELRIVTNEYQPSLLFLIAVCREWRISQYRAELMVYHLAGTLQEWHHAHPRRPYIGLFWLKFWFWTLLSTVYYWLSRPFIDFWSGEWTGGPVFHPQWWCAVTTHPLRVCTVSKSWSQPSFAIAYSVASVGAIPIMLWLFEVRVLLTQFERSYTVTQDSAFHHASKSQTVTVSNVDHQWEVHVHPLHCPMYGQPTIDKSCTFARSSLNCRTHFHTACTDIARCSSYISHNSRYISLGVHSCAFKYWITACASTSDTQGMSAAIILIPMLDY